MAYGESLLTLVQEFCDRRGLDRPSVVMASGDDTIRQIRALANEVLTDITGRGKAWGMLKKEATFNTVASEQQDLITNIAAAGFKKIIPDTMYNRTTKLPIQGPIGSAEFQAKEALPSSSPYLKYTIRADGYLYIQPAPPLGHVIYFEYESDYAVKASAGSTYKKRFTLDNDVFLLNSDLLFLGLNAKYRREKGLSYAQEQQDYEFLLNQEMGNDVTARETNIGGTRLDTPVPGFLVPAGNWRL